MWRKRTKDNLLLNDYEFYNHLHKQNSPSTSNATSHNYSHNHSHSHGRSNSTKSKQVTGVSNCSGGNSLDSGIDRKHHHRENLKGEEQLLSASNKLRALADLSINDNNR
jgi:hypothetical protein